MNSKLHAVTDQDGKPLILLLTPGQMSDHKGAALMLPALPKAKSLTGDKGYDSDAFRKALREKGIEPCIPPKKNRKRPLPYDEKLYKKPAPTPSSRRSASQQPSSSICDYES